MWNEFPDIKDRPKGKNDNRIKRLITVGMVIMLMFPTGVMADNVHNDVVADGNDTFTLGGSTVVNYYIGATGGDDYAGCNAGDGTPATVTINVPSNVVANPAYLIFEKCQAGSNKNEQPVTFTATSAGNYEITVSVSDSGTGTYNTNPAKFTLKVLAPPTPTDTTPPEITPNVGGTLGDNGWYISDVTVSWTVNDPESTISSPGCGPTTISEDTAGTTLTCSATSTGGTSSQSVTIKRDATPPTISGTASPAPNLAGWNNADVTVSFACDDELSGIDSCTPPVTFGEGAGQSVTGIAVDNAGNSATDTVDNINIDKTAPTVSVTGVANGAAYMLGSVPTAGCDTQDALSGVATDAILSISGGPVGSITATCSGAVDNAGNNGASAGITYTVKYNWNGFFRPVDNLPILNVAKAGSAIPVKFSLNGNQGLGIFAAGYPKSGVITCDPTAVPDSIEEVVTAGQSSLQYDATADQYIYVWKTDKTWTNCRQLQVKLTDGQTYIASFKFTK